MAFLGAGGETPVPLSGVLDTPLGPIAYLRDTDGRVAYPEVVRYRAEGREFLFPPAACAYRSLTLDRAKAEYLSRCGLLEIGHRVAKPPRRVDARGAGR